MLWVNDYPGYVHAFTTADDVASKFVSARELQTRVNTKAAFKEARAWIRDCAFHEQCEKPQEGPLSTRVIEVAPRDHPDQPRLLLSNGRIGSYAALSYCWGDRQEGITTLDFLQYNLNQLDVQKISQTVKDAIYCTKRLGIKFLWIDALCIVQDSDEDKAKEIPDMRYIFENSRVTIVAANSSSASIGFLGDRPPPGPRFRVPFPRPNGRTGTVSLRHEGRKAYCGASKEPINLRAWTLQENLLSRPVLFYAPHTLQYQCQTSVLNLGNSLFSPAGQDRLPSYFFAPREPQLRLTQCGYLEFWISGHQYWQRTPVAA